METKSKATGNVSGIGNGHDPVSQSTTATCTPLTRQTAIEEAVALDEVTLEDTALDAASVNDALAEIELDGTDSEVTDRPAKDSEPADGVTSENTGVLDETASSEEAKVLDASTGSEEII